MCGQPILKKGENMKKAEGTVLIVISAAAAAVFFCGLSRYLSQPTAEAFIINPKITFLSGVIAFMSCAAAVYCFVKRK